MSDDSSTTFAVVMIVILIVIGCLLFGIGGNPDGPENDPYGMPAPVSQLHFPSRTTSRGQL